MSDNWEDETFDTPVAVPPPKASWDDEDLDEDEIKDSWEESDEEVKNSEEAAPARKKVPLAQRIAERNAENERKKQELAAKKAAISDEESDEEDGMTLKQRQIAMEQAADLENANDMFRGVSLDDKESADKIASANPRTKEEFEVFMHALVERIEKCKSQRAYANFVEQLTVELNRALKDTDVRKTASALTRMANDKQRDAKAKEKKGKSKSKPSLQVASAAADTSGFGGAYGEDDYDDFM